MQICRNLFKQTITHFDQSNFHSLNQWFAFSLIHQRRRYISLLNQLIFTEVITEI